uniref:Protein MCM10 homolog n=1 Tax=Panagrellus redivivus TaxID=6233 RepID=A0A7E4VS25_PANRE
MSSSNLAALVEAFDDIDDEDIENTSIDATFQTAEADKTSNQTFTSCTEGNSTIDPSYHSAPEDFDEDAFAMDDFDDDFDETFTEEEKPGPSTPPKSTADRLRELVAESRQARKESSQEAAKNSAKLFPFSSNSLNSASVPSPAATSLADKKAAISKAFGAAAGPKDGIPVFDPAFGIRVKNPKITSTTLSTYLSDHKKFRPSHLRPNNQPKGDWFTMGVIVEKSEYKKSANKNEYMIWKISDLTNFQDTPVKVLLFGECVKVHWKLQVSSVVALTKPQFGESDDKTVTLKLSKSAQVIDVGFCPDFGTCKGNRNDGQKCSQYINTNSTEFCVYHIQKAAKSATVSRAVLGSQYNSPIGCRVTKPTVGRGGVANKVFMRPCMTKAEDTDKKPTKSALKTCSKDEAKALRDAENEKLQAAIKANSMTNFGARNLIKHRTERITDPVKASATKPGKTESPVDFKAFIRDQKEKLAPKRPVLSSRPTLAGDVGDFIDLDIVGGPKTPDRKLAEAQMNRARIAAKIRENGGLQKVDANATRKRLAPSSTVPSTETPKRSKLNPEDTPTSSGVDIAALLGRKSTFETAIDEADRAKEDAYFANAEIKEKIESRLTELNELKDVKVVTCAKCKYTAESQSSLCMIQGHVIQRHTATKRFFKCKTCKQRTAAFARIPTKPCDGCGSKSFDRVGMRDERKVGEDNKLVIRGEERKFVNR